MANMMLGGLASMRSNFSKSEMIESLMKFKGEHVKEYADALEVYQEDVRKKVKGWVKQTKEPFKNFHPQLGLNAPVNCESAYNEIIAVLAAAKEDTISLTLAEANSIFNNNWDWVQSASAQNMFYSSRKA